MARELGLKAVLQAWIGPDTAANELEVAGLIAAGQAGEAEMLVVGSEVLLRNDLPSSALIALINRVKTAVPGVPVAYADTYATLLANPEVLVAMDVVMVNYYPYWEGIGVETAVAALNRWHQQMVAASPGKAVVVAETGWPSAGNTVGSAVPSSGNANAVSYRC